MGSAAMSMQIKSIILYNANGQTRTINFRLGAVNIISGRFNTGKSAILQIVEYCLGNAEFEIPDGVIHQDVAWYGVLYQVNRHEVFVAKPKQYSTICKIADFPVLKRPDMMLTAPNLKFMVRV